MQWYDRLSAKLISLAKFARRGWQAILVGRMSIDRFRQDSTRPIPSDCQVISTKDLIDRFVSLRDATRRSAIYLFTAAGFLLSWSRSPGWHFKVPFNLFVDDQKQPLAVSCGYAPVFGPIIILFFYSYLYTLHNDLVPFAILLRRRLRFSSSEEVLIDLPFQLSRARTLESILFIVLVGLAPPILTVWLFCDFLQLKAGDFQMWQTCYHWCQLFGVVPEHRGESAQVYVYGIPQLLIYAALTGLELTLIYSVFCTVRSAGRAIRQMDDGRLERPGGHVPPA
jgi:hypothetical protein